jgi:transcriptional regulator with XRE-family HTH domain
MAAGLSQEELAARAGLSKNFLSAMERGEKSYTMRTLEKYLQGLGLEMAELFLSDPVAGEAYVRATYQHLPPSSRQTLLRLLQLIRDADPAVRNFWAVQVNILALFMRAQETTGQPFQELLQPPPAEREAERAP